MKKTKIQVVGILLLLSLTVFSSSLYAKTYTVKPGDSLYHISRNFGTSIESIRSANGLNSNTLYPGQTLYIPDRHSTLKRYTVRPGDSLYLIAKRHNLTVNDLRRANNLWHNEIRSGQTLYIPVRSSGSSSQSGKSYIVQPSDSLYQIARRYGVTINQLKLENNLHSNTIYPGQRLQIPQKTGTSSPSRPGNYSASDIELLARLVRAEAEGEPYEGMVAVAASVLNRVKDPRYPNSIPGVIYQVINGRYYQYSPVIDGRINLPSNSNSRRAVNDALKGWDPSRGATGFYNPEKTTNNWVRSHPITVRIGGHVFFKY